MEAQWQNSVSKSSENNQGEPAEKEPERKELSKKETDSTDIKKAAPQEVISAPIRETEEPELEMEKVVNVETTENSTNNEISKDSGHCSAT